MRNDPVKPIVYALVPFMFAVFLIVILPPALTLFGYLAEAVLALSIGYAISSDKVADMKDALNNGARAFDRQRAEAAEPKKLIPSQVAASPTLRPIAEAVEARTYPQRIIDEEAPSVPQNVMGNKRKVKK